MRSAREILFRLRQEVKNAVLLARPPSAHGEVGRAPAAFENGASAAVLRNTDYAKEVRRIAGEIRRHRFPLLGLTLDAGPVIQWRRDYASGKETGTGYFRRIPYLDASRAGDHKIIWELNRHQHLVLLAQAWLLEVEGSDTNLAEIFAQIESWTEANPYQRGINWASALEVAFRGLSWFWIYAFVGDQMPEGLRGRFLDSLYQHARHIENNLSFYFSPNTHLLGEGVALHALSGLFPEFRDIGAQVVADQMDKQVRDDGSHFEQSTYYHLYALDMFLFHAVQTDVSAAYRAKLERMAAYLDAVSGPQRRLQFLGDDDGGRFFHPFGSRDRFGRATLATCSVFFRRPEWLGAREDLYEQAVWWLGPQVLAAEIAPPSHASRLFAGAGMAVMAAGDRNILIDAGPFGAFGSGHSHADTLSIVVRDGDREILIDPGTYTYVGDEQWRSWFRGTGAHNTIRIGGRDQATPAGPFRWTDQPQARVNAWESTPDHDYVDAECSYRGFTHRRQVRFLKPGALHVIDEVSGPAGEHEIEQFWHLASPEAERCLTLDGEPQRLEGWRSDAFGEKHPLPVLRIHRRGSLPVKLETTIRLDF
jgi:hypothetical protein